MRAIEASVPLPADEAERAVREALAAEGFGVLTEIDVARVLKDKLGLERSPLKILGACNPNLAHQALERDPSVALVLPCNVVLEPGPEATRVAVVDPRELMPDSSFDDLAKDAAARIERALERAARAGRSAR